MKSQCILWISAPFPPVWGEHLRLTRPSHKMQSSAGPGGGHRSRFTGSTETGALPSILVLCYLELDLCNSILPPPYLSPRTKNAVPPCNICSSRRRSSIQPNERFEMCLSRRGDRSGSRYLWFKVQGLLVNFFS